MLEPFHGKGWARAVAQQALPPSAVWCLNAYTGIDREATTVGVACHVLGVMRFDVTACHKGPQDAFAHVGLHLGCCPLIESGRRVKRDRLCIWQRLKHPIDHADMKVHMRV